MSLRAIGVALLLVAGATARAQQMGTSAPTCMNSLFSANLGLRLPTQTVSPSSINYVFDRAECECHTTDIQMQIQVTSTMANPGGALQVWYGTSCDQSANRVANNQFCEMVPQGAPSFDSFSKGQTSATYINYSILSDPLFSPTMARACDPKQTANSVYFLASQTGDLSNPQICTFTLQENTQSPSQPTGVTAASGDSAVTLSWTLPQGTGEQVPVSYQVLCADQDGNPVASAHSNTQAYSVCLNGTSLRRRNTIPSAGATTTGGGTDDGGTTSVFDLSTQSAPFTTVGSPTSLTPETAARLAGHVPPAEPQLTDDGGTDGGTADLAGADLAPVPPALQFAASMDPAFTCSDEIKPPSNSVRIGGLTNGVTYHFVVLGIDAWGNPIASAVVDTSPQATDDLYRRYREEGGKASGFCFIATAAYGSYENRYVKVLRDFRDEILLPTATGRAFVGWYYTHSPPAAQVIAQHRSLRVLTQMVLWPVIGVAALVVYLSAWQKALLCILTFALLYLRRRRRQARTAEAA